MAPDPGELGAQLAFDIDGLLREARIVAAPPWSGAPLHFTAEYYPPADLNAAIEHVRDFAQPSEPNAAPHMWRRCITSPNSVEAGEHRFDIYDLDLRCAPWNHPTLEGEEHSDGCSCLVDLTYQAICAPCGWHDIRADENGCVEHWHDHAFPGWRALPIVPARFRSRDHTGLCKAGLSWIAEQYPTSIQVPGAPIVTERSTGIRHVGGRSPWGGYDLSHTSVDHGPRAQTPRDASPHPTPPSPSTSQPLATSRPAAQRQNAAVPLAPNHPSQATRGLTLGD